MQTTISVPTIKALFATAKSSGLKKPRFTVRHMDGYTYRIEAVSDFIRVYRVADRWKSRVATVMADGVLHASDERVIDLVKAIEADPISYLAECGRRAGRCCFCNTLLTDDHSGFSVRIGYGPVCAKRYNLPHGASAIVKEDRQAAANIERTAEESSWVNDELTPELMMAC